jgi:hypothetical protein
MRRIGAPQHWVTVFEDVLSGHIRSQLVEDDSASLTDALLVESSEIARRMPRHSSEPDVSGIEVSCQTAASLIGVKFMFVSTAVEIGFLAGERRGRDFAIPLQQVLKFQSEFVVAEEMREIFGGHHNSISCKLDRAGVKPAATIKQAKVWRRSDIERYVDQVGETAVKLSRVGEPEKGS